MAEKARVREAALAEKQREFWAKIEAESHEYLIQKHADSLTVEEAQDRLNENRPGCACTGGPKCCKITYEAAQRVLERDE